MKWVNTCLTNQPAQHYEEYGFDLQQLNVNSIDYQRKYMYI